MKGKVKFSLLILIFFFILVNCKQEIKTESNSVVKIEINEKDPLPSWNDTNTKSNILAYVKDVTNSESNNFIPIAERIATFDNDGNLWSEQPAYFQLFFAIDRVKTMAGDHPEWKEKQPFKAVLENDMETLKHLGMKAIVEIVMTTHAGITTEEFDAIVKDWVATAKHPPKNVGYDKLVYQPMIELLHYLGLDITVIPDIDSEWKSRVYWLPMYSKKKL